MNVNVITCLESRNKKNSLGALLSIPIILPYHGIIITLYEWCMTSNYANCCFIKKVA
jgi:hypothetical protein